MRIDGENFDIPVHVGQGLTESFAWSPTVKKSTLSSGSTIQGVNAGIIVKQLCLIPLHYLLQPLRLFPSPQKPK
ncbi:hypothetical protein [Nostoc sp.]